MTTDPDPAAVEAVAAAIGRGLDDFGCEGIDTAHVLARQAIAALPALGWVDGATKAKLVQRINNLERGLAATARERDAVCAAAARVLEQYHVRSLTVTERALLAAITTGAKP